MLAELGVRPWTHVGQAATERAPGRDGPVLTGVRSELALLGGQQALLVRRGSAVSPGTRSDSSSATAGIVFGVSRGSHQKLRRSFARVRTPWRAALVVALVIAVGALIAVLTRSTASGGVWDVSWRQCTNSGSTQALPGSPTIGIIGVNAGRPYTTNPCLKSELEWAGSAPQVYVNTNDPGPASARWPTTAQISPEKCVLTKPNGTTATPSCAYDYGWNAAQSAYTTLTNALVGQSKQPPSLDWWLDVESANTWLSSTALNTASIDGTIAYLDAHHVASVGIYANQNDSHTIFTPSSTFPAGTLSWLSTGETTLVAALSHCNYPGFTHSGVALVQYLPKTPAFDADAPCVGYISGPLNPVAGVAATGLTVNLVHPAPVGGVRLTLSSSSVCRSVLINRPGGRELGSDADDHDSCDHAHGDILVPGHSCRVPEHHGGWGTRADRQHCHDRPRPRFLACRSRRRASPWRWAQPTRSRWQATTDGAMRLLHRSVRRGRRRRRLPR